MNLVVITGANGFLGSHLTKRMLEAGVRVIAIDREGCNGHIPEDPRVQFIPCEMHALDGFPDLDVRPDAFYHFAWQGVAPELRDDFDVQYANVGYALNAARLAGRMGAGKFILPGSTMEYAYTPNPIDAAACPTPQNAYGSAKIACRFLCEALCGALKLPFLYAVITSIYGIGREDSNVIFYVIRELLAGRRPSLTQMRQRWDYIHIKDAMEALYLVGLKGKPAAFYAMGNGENLPLSEYVLVVRDLIDPSRDIGIGEVPYKTDKIPHSMINPAALREDTGFAATIPFQQGIGEVVDYYKERWKNEAEHG